jgi:hypothetical protein
MRSMTRRLRGPWTVRPRARRGIAPEVQALEGRQLLSSAPINIYAPSDAAQYMLELINRARANPAAEGQRLLAMVRNDPILQDATQGWDLRAFLKEIDSFGPEPPLAFNTRLNAATPRSPALSMVKRTTPPATRPGPRARTSSPTRPASTPITPSRS